MEYEYSNSEIKWIGKYPKHWKVFRISQRVESIVGGEWGSDPDTDDTEGSKEIVVLRVSDFNDIYLSYDNLTLRRVKETKIPNRLITSNCLIMEKSGGGEKQLVGRVAEAKDLQFEAITSNFIAKLEFDTKVYNHFMNYVFHDLYNSNLNFPFVQQTTGIQNINSTYYLYTKIPFPPKLEQIAIVNYLDKACSDIESVVEIKRKQIENLQQQLKSIIYHSITKGLNPKKEMIDSGIDWIGKTPKHWRKEKIFRSAEFVTSGGTPKSTNEEYYYEGYIPWIQSGDLNDGYITETEKRITSEGLQNSSAKLFPKDTLLVAMYGATIGKLGIQTMEAATNQACCAIFPVKRIALQYLYYFFLAIRDKYISDAYGGGQPNISQSLIKQTYFFVPDKKEQIEIYEFLDNELKKVNTVHTKIERQIETILNYKKSLIHEVVTGKKQVYGLSKEKTKLQTA